MKSLFTFLASVVVVVLLSLIVSCDDDEKVGIPTVTTLQPVTAGTHVYFEATLSSRASISRVGFHFTTAYGSQLFEAGSTFPSLKFEAYVPPDHFIAGASYTVRAFFYLNNEIHYGNTISFTYLPSQVTGVFPETGSAGTTVTITGIRFPQGKTTVSFNGLNAPIVSSSETQLVVKVPEGLARGYHSGTVTCEGVNIHYFNFYVSLTTISKISPTTGTFNDVITISGKGFSSSSWGNSVYFEGHYAQIIEATTTELKVLVPFNLALSSSIITVQSDGELAQAPEPFILAEPTFDFSPKSGDFGTTVTLTGDNFNPTGYLNQVFFGDALAQVLEASRTSMKVIVPNEYNSPAGRSQIRLAYGTDFVVSPDEFELNTHSISSISPDVATRGTAITITGTNFNPEPTYNNITIGSVIFQPVQATTTSLTFTLPPGVSGGEFDLRVTTGGREVIAPFTLTVKDPWFKKANLGGGARYGGFGFAIGNLGYIGGGFNNSGFLKNDFYAYDPQANTWTRKADLPVNGQGMAFFSTETHGYLVYQKELWEYDPLTNKWTSKAEFPGAAIRNQGAFVSGGKAYVGGGSTFSGSELSERYSYDFSTDEWTSNGYSPYGFQRGFNAGGQAYLITYDYWNSTQIKKFAPPDAWVVVTFPPDIYNLFYYRQEVTVISGENLGYFGGGSGSWTGVSSDFYSIHPTSDEIKRLSDMPYSRQSAMGFSIGGKVYVGGGTQDSSPSSARSDFYLYDPEKEP